MTLRSAGPDDVPAVLALEEETFGVDAWSRQTVEAELCGPRRVALVVSEGTTLVGYVMVMVTAEVVDVHRLAVTESHRRAGLATMLLEAGIEQAAGEDVTRVLLEVAVTNEPAIAFYVQAGFREIGRRQNYYRDGSDAVVMERHLGT